jgi:hypothetical protein
MKKICGEIILQPTQPPPPFFGTKGIHEARLTACAKKAWERWENREKEGWRDYCRKDGKGGGSLMRCGSCKTVKVRYCCKSHQKAGWKLHKHTC